jgi:hypothetical protein
MAALKAHLADSDGINDNSLDSDGINGRSLDSIGMHEGSLDSDDMHEGSLDSDGMYEMPMFPEHITYTFPSKPHHCANLQRVKGNIKNKV